MPAKKYVETEGSDLSAADGGPDEPMVAVFMPALIFFLYKLEKEKGAPLSEDEVKRGLGMAPSIMMTRSDAQAFQEQRGFVDINPDNVWQEWQFVRTRI